MPESIIIRKPGETAIIGDNLDDHIRVRILEVNGEQVKLQIEASGYRSVQKEEDFLALHAEEIRLRAEREAAWQTYLEHEQELLRDHYGEFVWVLPGEIRATCRTKEEMAKVLTEQKSQGRGILVRVDEREAPVIPMSSPEIKLQAG